MPDSKEREAVLAIVDDLMFDVTAHWPPEKPWAFRTRVLDAMLAWGQHERDKGREDLRKDLVRWSWRKPIRG